MSIITITLSPGLFSILGGLLGTILATVPAALNVVCSTLTTIISLVSLNIF